jgi:hypothetical protein
MGAVSTGDPVIEAFLTTGDGTIHRTLRTDAAPGEVVAVTWRIAPGPPGSVLTDGELVTVPPTATQITVGVGHGDTVDDAQRIPSYQHRWWVRTSAGVIDLVAPGRTFENVEDSADGPPNWLELFEPTTLSAEVRATDG